MSVVTGETGAGKSILLQALNLALDGRGDATLVRLGADKAEISASFDVAHYLKIQNYLTHLAQVAAFGHQHLRVQKSQ